MKIQKSRFSQGKFRHQAQKLSQVSVSWIEKFFHWWILQVNSSEYAWTFIGSFKSANQIFSDSLSFLRLFYAHICKLDSDPYFARWKVFCFKIFEKKKIIIIWGSDESLVGTCDTENDCKGCSVPTEKGWFGKNSKGETHRRRLPDTCAPCCRSLLETVPLQIRWKQLVGSSHDRQTSTSFSESWCLKS